MEPALAYDFSCDNNSCNDDTAPWRGDWYRAVSTDDDIVIIGGGLTAMDPLLNFEETNTGKIAIICPKGLLPPSQQDWWRWEFHWPVVKTASAFLGVMTRHLGKRIGTINHPGQVWTITHPYLHGVAAFTGCGTNTFSQTSELALAASSIPRRPTNCSG